MPNNFFDKMPTEQVNADLPKSSYDHFHWLPSDRQHVTADIF